MNDDGPFFPIVTNRTKGSFSSFEIPADLQYSAYAGFWCQIGP